MDRGTQRGRKAGRVAERCLRRKPSVAYRDAAVDKNHNSVVVVVIHFSRKPITSQTIRVRNPGKAEALAIAVALSCGT